MALEGSIEYKDLCILPAHSTPLHKMVTRAKNRKLLLGFHCSNCWQILTKLHSSDQYLAGRFCSAAQNVSSSQCEIGEVCEITVNVRYYLCFNEIVYLSRLAGTRRLYFCNVPLSTSPWAEVDAIKITFTHTALVIYAFLDIYGAVTRMTEYSSNSMISFSVFSVVVSSKICSQRFFTSVFLPKE